MERNAEVERLVKYMIPRCQRMASGSVRHMLSNGEDVHLPFMVRRQKIKEIVKGFCAQEKAEGNKTLRRKILAEIVYACAPQQSKFLGALDTVSPA